MISWKANVINRPVVWAVGGGKLRSAIFEALKYENGRAQLSSCGTQTIYKATLSYTGHINTHARWCGFITEPLFKNFDRLFCLLVWRERLCLLLC